MAGRAILFKDLIDRSRVGSSPHLHGAWVVMKLMTKSTSSSVYRSIAIDIDVAFDGWVESQPRKG